MVEHRGSRGHRESPARLQHQHRLHPVKHSRVSSHPGLGIKPPVRHDVVPLALSSCSANACGAQASCCHADQTFEIRGRYSHGLKELVGEWSKGPDIWSPLISVIKRLKGFARGPGYGSATPPPFIVHCVHLDLFFIILFMLYVYVMCDVFKAYWDLDFPLAINKSTYHHHQH